MYTVSITLAGLCCLPVIGPSANIICCLCIALYGFGLKTCAQPATFAIQTLENSRDMFDDPRFQSVLSSHAPASACPFAHATGEARSKQLRALFDSMDTDGSGDIDQVRPFDPTAPGLPPLQPCPPCASLPLPPSTRPVSLRSNPALPAPHFLFLPRPGRA